MKTSEFTANNELAQTEHENQLMNERKPLKFDSEDKPQHGDKNDSSTWELV